MLEHIFARTHVIARLRCGPLGSYLDDFATSLRQHGVCLSKGGNSGSDITIR